MSTASRRQYRSELRREQAAATRQRIADAARSLMLRHGYAVTTMAEVARVAGVAVQTLYATCPGGKAGLAKLVYDATLAGDAQPVPMAERPPVQAIVAEADPGRKLELYASMVLSVAERITPVHRVLRAAAAATPADENLHGLLHQAELQHRAGSRGPAAHLAEVGALRDGLTVDQAADQIYALSSIEVYERLTEICRWSGEEYCAWLAATLSSTLLETPTPRRTPRN
ncbi:TetR/AcrR family transcriptional regulator [Micromonospora marina]|uniref:TetR/AcrR family transcriptional regulator n=1 Tax=Micromonospora marina TaxID=307120 RepID=UPI00345607CA